MTFEVRYTVTVPTVSLIRCQAHSVPLSTDPMPGTLLSDGSAFDPHSDPVRLVFYHPHFTEEEFVAQRG